MQNKVYWMMGGSGSGKSIAADAIRKNGINVIDADKVAHDILLSGKEAYKEVLENFGKDFLLQNGEIDRKKLGKYVFSNPEKLEILNDITHKYIKNELLRLKGDSEVTVFDAPLPPDGFIEPDHILYILAPVSERISRISRRDGISDEDALQRIENQKHIDEYVKNADTIIENSGDVEDFIKKITDWCRYEKII